MARPGYGKEFWAKVRDEYEEGTGLRKLAAKYKVAQISVQRHRDKEGWDRPDPEFDEYLANLEAELDVEAAGATIPEPETATSTSVIEEEVVTASGPAQRIAELEAKLTETETALIQAEAEARRHDPQVEVPHLATLENYLEHVPAEVLDELALSSLALENVKRNRDGKPKLTFDEDRIAEEIQRIINKRIRGLTGNVRGDDAMRVLKMVKPNGTMTQVPVEPQINNEAGQEGAAVMKARRKNFKVAFPIRCFRHNCWQLSAVDEAGNRTLDGYCSPEHRAGDPFLGGAPVPGVSTSARAMDGTRADAYLSTMG